MANTVAQLNAGVIPCGDSVAVGYILHASKYKVHKLDKRYSLPHVNTRYLNSTKGTSFMGVNTRSTDSTNVHLSACKYKGHKLHKTYIFLHVNTRSTDSINVHPSACKYTVHKLHKRYILLHSIASYINKLHRRHKLYTILLVNTRYTNSTNGIAFMGVNTKYTNCTNGTAFCM